MTFFLKLRHWELLPMRALPTLLCLMFSIPFKPQIVSTVGLFMMLLWFMWMLGLGTWYTAGRLKTLLESKEANDTIFSTTLLYAACLPARCLADSTGCQSALYRVTTIR